jgi:hypothetical protein
MSRASEVTRGGNDVQPSSPEAAKAAGDLGLYGDACCELSLWASPYEFDYYEVFYPTTSNAIGSMRNGCPYPIKSKSNIIQIRKSNWILDYDVSIARQYLEN